MFGKDWHEYEGLLFDEEHKISIFDYERFLPKGLLETSDWDSEEFKRYIKKLSFEARTEYEQHQDNQKYF